MTAKKIDMRTKTIKIPLYTGKLTIIQTDDFKALEKQYNLENIDNTIEAFVFKNYDKKPSPTWVIVLPENVKLPVVVHECVHLTNFVFNHVRIKLDSENDENQAYLTEWFFEQIQNFIK